MLENAHTSAAELQHEHPAEYLNRYLRKIGAQTVVVEEKYNDIDYLDDFASYYVRCYPEYERFCKRIHFFKARFTDRRLRKVIGHPGCMAEDVLKSSYLGFIVARPLPSQVVGRTLLDTYDDDHGRRRYSTLFRHKVNLFGIPLTIRSLPYQQQDTAVSACATVAIWSALHGASALFGTPAPRPMQITLGANKVQSGSRSIPSRGLTLEQMCQAITSVGLEPEVYTITESTPVLSIAYAYLAMGLPVILGVDVNDDGHAVCLTGCSVNEVLPCGETSLKGVPLIGRRIDELFVHDDGIGPFSWIRTSSVSVLNENNARHKSYPIVFQSSWHDHGSQRALMFPRVMVVPSHAKMRIRYTDIERSLRSLHRVVSSLFEPTIDLEWEPRLLMSNAYKQELRSRRHLTSSESVFLLNSQPRFLWCITLRANGGRIFDLIIDATDLPYATPLQVVLWRNGGFETAFKAIAATVRDRLEMGLGSVFVDRLLA